MRNIFLFAILFLFASCGPNAGDYPEVEYTPVFSEMAEFVEIPAQELLPEELPALCEEATPAKADTELPDETQAILAMHGFAPILNAYAEFERSGFATRDENLIAPSFFATNIGTSRWEDRVILYAFHDMNGDGVPELFIGSAEWTYPRIVSVYALRDGAPELVFYEWSNNIWLQLLSDIYGNYIISERGGRFGILRDSIYALDEEGNSLKLDTIVSWERAVGVCECCNLDVIQTTFHRSIGGRYFGDEDIELSKDEYLAILGKYGILDNIGYVALPWEYVLPPPIPESHGFEEILNAYAEISRYGFSVQDEFFEHIYFVERDYRIRRDSHENRSDGYAPALKYALRDINGDGAPELFIGIGTACDSGRAPLIYVIYTKQNGVPVPVIFQDNHHSVRLSADIYGEYVISSGWARMGEVGHVAFALDENGYLIRLDYVTAAKVWSEDGIGSILDRHFRYASGLTPTTEAEYDAFFIRYGIYRYSREGIELQWTKIL